MSIQKNETAIQVLKILYSQNRKKSKKIKKTHYKAAYPRAIEAKYKTKLSSYFQPLINYVNKFLEENKDALLRGDSGELKLDVLPGGTFKRMTESLNSWMSVYMPTVWELKEGQNNVILMGLNQTAEQLKEHENRQFQKQLENGIGVSFQTDAPWWPDTKANWESNNYNLIVSNASNYVNQINNLVEQAVVNGWSPKQLQEQIKKASKGLTDKKCSLLARDQISKLQGQVAEAQMEEIGLEMYVWDTSGDERVRSSHKLMDGLLCRWDNPNVYSVNNGKTWTERPSGAVRLHPGQDIQCRCIALAYIPELISEVSGEPIKQAIEKIVESILPTLDKEQLKDKLYIETNMKDFFDKYNMTPEEVERFSTSLAYRDMSYLPERVLNDRKIIDNLFSERYLRDRNYSTQLILTEINLRSLEDQINILRDLKENGKPFVKFNITQARIKELTDALKEGASFNSTASKKIIEGYDYTEFLAYSSRKVFTLETKEMSRANAYGNLKYSGFYDEFKDSKKTFFSYYLTATPFQSEDNGYYTLENVRFAKEVAKQFEKTNFDLKDTLKPERVARVINKPDPQESLPWGTASENNENAWSVAFWDTKYRYFDKETQKLIDDEKFIGSMDIGTFYKSINNRLYAQEVLHNPKKVVEHELGVSATDSQKYQYLKDGNFTRILFDYGDKETEYKVGQIIDETGIAAFTTSEYHNWLWVRSKTRMGAKNPVRLVLKKDEKSISKASAIINDDLGTGWTNSKNPEEVDFSISKYKVTKIEDSVIPGKEEFKVKNVYVEIVD